MKKLTLTLTAPQAHALFNLFNDLVLPDFKTELDMQLVMLHMISIYKKLRDKWEGETRKAYKLNITLTEAIAYRIYWRDNEVSGYAYEWAMLISHCMQIDKELADRRRMNNTSNKLLNQ